VVISGSKIDIHDKRIDCHYRAKPGPSTSCQFFLNVVVCLSAAAVVHNPDGNSAAAPPFDSAPGACPPACYSHADQRQRRQSICYNCLSDDNFNCLRLITVGCVAPPPDMSTLFESYSPVPSVLETLAGLATAGGRATEYETIASSSDPAAAAAPLPRSLLAKKAATAADSRVLTWPLFIYLLSSSSFPQCTPSCSAKVRRTYILHVLFCCAFCHMTHCEAF
jgi:hypothetical protein